MRLPKETTESTFPQSHGDRSSHCRDGGPQRQRMKFNPFMIE